MRIAILLLAAGRKAGGPETYEVELIRNLARLDHATEFFVYTAESEAESIIGVQQPNVHYRHLKPRNRVLMLTFGCQRQMREDRIDLLHCTYAPPPFASGYIFTMHCVSNLVHPEYYGRSKGFRLNLLQRRAFTRAKEILCVSNFVRHELSINYGVPLDRTSVVYNGVDPCFQPAPPDETLDRLSERFGITKPYMLYAGKIQSRKNTIRLIKAYNLFREWALAEGADANLQLVLTGKRTDAGAGIADAISKSRFARDIIETGYIPSPSSSPASDLPLLYRSARMFIFPSLFEGFGIPLIEAMASGVPALSSNFTSLPEVAGDAALLVDPYSIHDLALGMSRLHKDEDLRRTLRQRGLARARQFTWEQCARQTLDAYRRAIG